MDSEKRALLIACLLIVGGAAGLRGQSFFDNSYAVVIGINRYANQKWPMLTYATGDARAMEAYLRRQGFRVIPLYDQNATKQAILETMQSTLAPRLGPRDRVVVFFAGHGYTETLGGQEKGYVIPYDGTNSSASFVSVADLREQSSNMGNARHQLFLMDSCFGGMLATRGVRLEGALANNMRELANRVSRQVLTAGGKNQEVLDGGAGGHSPFAAALLSGLQEGLADTNGDGYITFPELESYVISVASNANQTPASSTMPGHQGGQFFFVSPNGVASQPHRSEKNAAATVRQGETDAAVPRTVPDASAATRAAALPLPRAPVSSAPLGKMDVELVHTLAEPDTNYELKSVAFNPTNPVQLASASALPSFAGSGKIHLWDVTTGQIASTLQRPGEHPEDQFWTLAYSPNGAYLAVTTQGMNKHSGVLELWNPQNGSLVRSFGGGSLDLESESAAFSPDGRMVAVGDGIYPFQVFNTETGTPIKALPSPGVIAVFAFSPDGSLLAVGSRDWRPPVRLWNTRTWTRFHDINAQAPSYGEAIAFSPDGKTIATGHYRGGMYLWDVATGALLHTMRYKDTEGGESRSIYFSPDGRFLTFISGGHVQFWSPATGKLLGNFAFGGKSIALHPSGLLLAGATKSAIQIWQLHPTEVKSANSEPGGHK